MQDNYDTEVQEKILIGGDEVDVWIPGTYTITYDVTDAAGNSAATAYTFVTVKDTVDPILSYYTNEFEVMEASDRGPYDIGAKCTDTCTPLTSAGLHAQVHGPAAPDMPDVLIGVTVEALEYEYFVGSYEEYSFDDSQQYYCGDSIDSMEETALSAQDENDVNVLSDTCGVYEITYHCEDWAGNEVSATQYVVVIDTIDPEIYFGTTESYTDSTISFLAKGGMWSWTPMAVGIAMVAAGVALVASRLRRRSYQPIPL